MLRNVASECVRYKRACVLLMIIRARPSSGKKNRNMTASTQGDEAPTDDDGDVDVPRSYKSGDLISIVDGNGHVLDAEPALDVLENNDLVSPESCQPNLWLLCKITTLTNNAVELQKDSVFHGDGTTMNRTELRCASWMASSFGTRM